MIPRQRGSGPACAAVARPRPVADRARCFAGLGLVGVLWLHMDGVWRQYGWADPPHGLARIDFQSDPTRQLVNWIRASTAPSARILIVGDLPRPGRSRDGCKAYLQPLTGRPLVGLPVNVKCVDLDALRASRGARSPGALEAFNIRHVVIRDDDPPMQERLDEVAVLRLREVLSAFRVYDVDIPPTYLIGARGWSTSTTTAWTCGSRTRPTG